MSRVLNKAECEAVTAAVLELDKPKGEPQGRTRAARIQIVLDLLDPPPWVDGDGNKQKSPPLITKEQAIALLSDL